MTTAIDDLELSPQAVAAVEDALRAFAKALPPGAWIMGGDWDHTLWGGQLPEKSWVDSVTGDHPLWIISG